MGCEFAPADIVQTVVPNRECRQAARAVQVDAPRICGAETGTDEWGTHRESEASSPPSLGSTFGFGNNGVCLRKLFRNLLSFHLLPIVTLGECCA